VAATGEEPRDGARRVASNAVGHQPLATLCHFQTPCTSLPIPSRCTDSPTAARLSGPLYSQLADVMGAPSVYGVTSISGFSYFRSLSRPRRSGHSVFGLERERPVRMSRKDGANAKSVRSVVDENVFGTEHCRVCDQSSSGMSSKEQDSQSSTSTRQLARILQYSSRQRPAADGCTAVCTGRVTCSRIRYG
jgi:hypothetical protein